MPERDGFKKAKRTLKKGGTLFVEEYISYLHNFGFQFGIPFNKEKASHHRLQSQVTAADGEFGRFYFKRTESEKGTEDKEMIVREIRLKFGQWVGMVSVVWMCY